MSAERNNNKHRYDDCRTIGNVNLAEYLSGLRFTEMHSTQNVNHFGIMAKVTFFFTCFSSTIDYTNHNLNPKSIMKSKLLLNSHFQFTSHCTPASNLLRKRFFFFIFFMCSFICRFTVVRHLCVDHRSPIHTNLDFLSYAIEPFML